MIKMQHFGASLSLTTAICVGWMRTLHDADAIEDENEVKNKNRLWNFQIKCTTMNEMEAVHVRSIRYSDTFSLTFTTAAVFEELCRFVT